ncbi:probable G-protein coupled receptor Mth-like 1 isoform X1 [Schistocerca cancellata]|uniref:probable G-protein coupled receptor Mth-like 1 isoform X1 n=1 Tax=Schistocerca cancellata TaxID=274614 RepID=UPI0021193551|nr:probable G-protein coupled receptor Mth-like 1 isoform X1 [Schistocerca cancellata]
MVVVALFVAVVVAAVEQCSADEPLVVRVNKCCPLHQQLAINMTTCLDYDYEKYEVARTARSTPTPSTAASSPPPPPRLPWWVSAKLRVVMPSGQEVGAAGVAWLASPGAAPGCPAPWRSLVMQHLNQFTVTHDGRMLLYDAGDDDDDGVDDAPLELPAGAFCLDRIKVRQDGEGRLVALACQCSSASVWCWRSCCPSGYKLDVAELDRVHQNVDCVRDASPEAPRPWLPKLPNMRRREVYGFPKCEKGEHISETYEAQSWQLLANGSALVGGVALAQPLERYCADAAGHGGRGQLLYCSDRSVSWKPNRQRGLLYGLLFGLGAIFLLATVLLYSCLPGLLARMHARAVVCHATSLLGAYVALAVMQTWPEMPLPACSAAAFIVQYSFLAAFFWLNVMCLDISWAFSGLRSLQGGAWDGDRRRFWWFSAYAWGGAALVCAATAAVEFSDSVPKGAKLKPDFGAVRCWFRGREATLLFFYGPVAVLLLGNLSLFTYTAVKIVSAHKETQILNMVDGRRRGKSSGHSVYRKERQRLVLYTKLFGLMGLTWVMEIVSWAVGGPAYYWYLTDLVNLLRAVFLFYLFCCKRSVLRLLRSRLPSWCPCSLPPSEGHGGSGSGSSKSKTETRSRSLTSQRTTSFKLTEQQILQLTQQALPQQLDAQQPPERQTQQANGHATSPPDTTPI